MKRVAKGVAGAAVVLLVLFVASFAVPLRIWRTGELPAATLPVVHGGPSVAMTRRVWIDTDAACGHGPTTDPDDCFALSLLVQAPGIEVVGISTVFGNASVDVTDATTRSLVDRLRTSGGGQPPVHRGATAPSDIGASLASGALRRALEAGPLTIVALGPLANIASALEERPDLRERVTRLVAVMGRRPGHLFHPAEGKGEGAMLLGHGPVFLDFNFDKDRAAATSVLAMRLPMTLMPYQAAREISIDEGDVAALELVGGAVGRVAAGARPWLDFWRTEVGLPGFYPFDLLAAAYVLDPGRFACAAADAWVSTDERLWNFWFYDPPALLVGLPMEMPDAVEATSPVVYCTGADPDLHSWLVRTLGGRSLPSG